MNNDRISSDWFKSTIKSFSQYNNLDKQGKPNGLATLDANGKLPTSQLPATAIQVVGYLDAANEHVLPSAEEYSSGNEIIITSAGYYWADTGFTLEKGSTLTDLEVSQANALIYLGYRFTIEDEDGTVLGIAQAFTNNSIVFTDGSSVVLPYEKDLENISDITLQIASGSTLTEDQAEQANGLKAYGSTLTLLDSTKTAIGTIKTVNTDSIVLTDDTTYSLPYSTDLYINAKPAAIQVSVQTGDTVINVDNHWIHMENASGVLSVNGMTGSVVITKSTVGLSNVDNVSEETILTDAGTKYIKDDTVSSTTVLSSQKINDDYTKTEDTLSTLDDTVKTPVNSSGVENLIDDTDLAKTNKVLSSNKVSTTFVKKADVLSALDDTETEKPVNSSAVHSLIDDDVKSDSQTWSSTKINDAVDSVNPSWTGTTEEWDALDKSTLKDNQQINITDDYDNSDFLSYFTEETWTGGYWIDGKKIYRKVITGITVSSDSAVDVSIGATIDTCVNLRVFNANAGGNIGTEYWYSSSNYVSARISNAKTSVEVHAPTQYSSSPFTIIIEYTK